MRYAQYLAPPSTDIPCKIKKAEALECQSPTQSHGFPVQLISVFENKASKLSICCFVIVAVCSEAVIYNEGIEQGLIITATAVSVY